MMLGILLPDDGPQRYEWHDLGRWFADRGVAELPLRIAGTACDGLHTEASLRRTGSLDVLVPPAQALAAQGASAILWACTSGSFIGGLAWAREQADGLRSATGRPASSTALALLAALAALETEEVDLVSPYPAPVTARLVGFLHDGGVRTAETIGLDCPSSADSHRLDLRREVARLPGSGRPIVIPDTAVDSLDLLEPLEAAAGRPVVTANQASLWFGLRMSGCSARLPRAGRLFRTDPPAL